MSAKKAEPYAKGVSVIRRRLGFDILRTCNLSLRGFRGAKVAPSLGKVGIGLAYMGDVEVGDEVEIAVNPRRNLPAVVVRPPFI